MKQADNVDINQVIDCLKSLQDKICNAFESLETTGFHEDAWQHANGGGGRTRVLSNGSVFEQGGVNFSHVRGEKLPAAASAKRPHIAGKPFTAVGVSLVVHPLNPYVPTSHMNVRFFIADPESDNPVWWFGGGFDLTPYYGFEEDALHWHRTAKQACDGFGEHRYEEYKKWCDEYFYLRHRNEARGVGGLFFDDLNEGGFENCFAFLRAVGDGYLDAYIPIVKRRTGMQYGERERSF